MKPPDWVSSVMNVNRGDVTVRVEVDSLDDGLGEHSRKE